MSDIGHKSMRNAFILNSLREMQSEILGQNLQPTCFVDIEENVDTM